MSGLEPLLIAAAGAAVSGGLAMGQASNRNDSIRRAAGTTEESAKLQAQQLAERRAQQIEDNRREAAALRGRLRATTAELGTGFAGSSFEALDTSILGSLDRAQRSVETNYSNARQQIQLGTQARIDDLFSQYQNPVTAGLSGSLQGALTGLQIYDGIGRLTPSKPPIDRFPYGS